MAKEPSIRDSWATPQDVFEEISRLYGPFDLDAAASQLNRKCEAYFSERDNALERGWCVGSGRVWLNPPYSNVTPWFEKAIAESQRGCKVVMLVNRDHTTKWWKRFVMDGRNSRPGVEVWDYPRRIKFVPPPGLISKKTGKPVKATTNTFPSAVIVFHPRGKE